ncbi:hypothetical protein WJX74_006439 [Apatococcus lobatus]|uniref:Coilin n=1 Tax=Apatococcus lobatus TaxID=904363 RepID=A0AAW1S0U4_9CHLO
MPSRSLRIVLLWGVQSLKVLREGSSACWYVVPAKLKLVQDLAQQVAADFETQLPAEHLALLLKGATLLPDTPISVLQDGDQVIVSPHISWWQQQQQQDLPLLLGAPDSAQPSSSAPRVISAGPAALQLQAPVAAAPAVKAAPPKGRQTKRAERVPNGSAAAAPAPAPAAPTAAAKKSAGKRKRQEERQEEEEESSSSDSSSSSESDSDSSDESSDESSEQPSDESESSDEAAPVQTQKQASSSEESSSEQSSSEDEEADVPEPGPAAAPKASQLKTAQKAPQPSPAAAPTPLTPAAAKKGEDPPRSSRSARRKQKKRQLRRMGLLPAKPVLAQKRKAEEVEAEDITPAKVAATAAGSKQLSVKGLPKRGDDGHRRMPLKQHIVFDEPGGGQADADSHGNSHEAGLKNSQAGRGTRTALGGTVDEQVARLQAAEETSSEDEQSPDAAPRQAVDRSKAHGIANFEALPRLQRHPMYGDVLAYRLLEIGADFTPQVAEWRLGSVNSWNVKTQATVLYPWPDVNVHPVHGVGAPSSTHADQESLEDEEGPPSAYDEQGVLTAEAAAFSDRRLAQAAPDAPPNSPNPRERTPAGSSPTRRTPPLTAMDAKQPLRDDPGAAAFPEANADADAATANPNPTAVQELAAAGLLSPDAKRPAPRPRGTTDLVDSTEPAAQAASAPTLGKAADTSQTGAFQLTLRQAGSGPPKANLPVKLPPSRPGSTIPALGAWADYAAAFQKRRHELAAAKASGTSVTLPHGPPTLRSHLPGPPYPRPTPHPHPRSSPSTATPAATHAGSISNAIANAMTAAGELDTVDRPSGRLLPPGMAAVHQPHSPENGPGSVPGTLEAGAGERGISGRARAAARDALATNGASVASPRFKAHHVAAQMPEPSAGLGAPEPNFPRPTSMRATDIMNGRKLGTDASNGHTQQGQGAAEPESAAEEAADHSRGLAPAAAAPGIAGKGPTAKGQGMMSGRVGSSGRGVGGPGASRPKSGVRGASIGRLLNQMRASGEL